MGSSNTSFTTKSCACTSMTFLAGGNSWSVETITADGKDKHDNVYGLFEKYVSNVLGKSREI